MEGIGSPTLVVLGVFSSTDLAWSLTVGASLTLMMVITMGMMATLVQDPARGWVTVYVLAGSSNAHGELPSAAG